MAARLIKPPPPAQNKSGAGGLRVLISEREIAARVKELAAEINARYRGTRKLIVVGLLRGSFMFVSDIVRLLKLPVEVDFLTASSYDNAQISSRDVRILKDLNTSIAGMDVVVVEDIVDTGYTLSKVLDILRTRAPKTLSVCALLDKPSRREVRVDVDWAGFTIPNLFVVGYGVDAAQLNRNLPYIGFVEDAAPVGAKEKKKPARTNKGAALNSKPRAKKKRG